MAEEAVIVAGCRTPIGRFMGGLSDVPATRLGAVAVAEAIRRSGLGADAVEEVIMGNVLQAGLGQNPARQAALGAGVPEAVPAFTVNKVCGSSLKAVMLAAQAIKAGDRDVLVAGGMESMSNAPHLLMGSRKGIRMGDGRLLDHMVHDGLWDVYNDYHMGETGEIVAERHDVSRADADALAARSHARAAKARADGLFDAEIVPVEVPRRKGDPVVVDKDEGIREGTEVTGLEKLRPVFRKEGLVTAGNASQISDGGSAVVVASRRFAEDRGLPVLATIEAYDAAGTRPEWVMEAPIVSVQNMLKSSGTKVEDVDLWEHNEAFASASCAVQKKVGIPEDRFNIRGGAVALGHPIGASGTRVLVTLLHALKDTGGGRGVATLCLGGGNAVSMMVNTEG